jgi:hypothetical protein
LCLKGNVVKAIRVVGVGLLVSALIMSQVSIGFFREWTESTALHAFVLALNSMAPGVVSGTGMGVTAVIVLTLASVGLGMLASAIFYSALEDMLIGLVRGSLRRADMAARGPSSRLEARAHREATATA